MKPVTETDYRARIELAIRALSDEPEAPHTVDELARIAHLSPFHCHRIYRAMVGESVIETARRLRLARAALLLATTDSPVTDVDWSGRITGSLRHSSASTASGCRRADSFLTIDRRWRSIATIRTTRRPTT